MNEETLEGKKVVIALSGGKSSAMAAYILKKQGMKVSAVYFGFMPTSYLEDGDKDQEEKLAQAKKIANWLGISFSFQDISHEFEEVVISKFIASRVEGQRDSSLFNKAEFLIQKLDEERKKLDANYMSTGHFAKTNFNLKTSEYSIHTCIDANSDNSHFLGGVDKSLISHLILPLGDLKRSDVQKLVGSLKLEFPSSSEIKFLPFSKQIKEKIFKNAIPQSLCRKGSFIRIDNEISSLSFESHIDYEVGGPSGDRDLEILSFDHIKGNYFIGSKEYARFKELQVVDINWAKGNFKNYPLSCYIKVESIKNLLEAKVHFKNNNSCYLVLEEEIYPVLRGEVITFYEKSARSSRLIGQGRVNNTGKLRLKDAAEEIKNTEVEDDHKTHLPFTFHF